MSSAWDIPGFEAPQGPPQLDAGLPGGDIETLMLEAPIFTEEAGPELLELCRRYSTVRSVIMYAMQEAVRADRTLKTADDAQELFRAQGEFRGLNRYTEQILAVLKAAETPEPKEHQDELEE